MTHAEKLLPLYAGVSQALLHRPGAIKPEDLVTKTREIVDALYEDYESAIIFYQNRDARIKEDETAFAVRQCKPPLTSEPREID